MFKYLYFLVIHILALQLAAGERDISYQWCISNHGIPEVRTKYGTYADCITNEYAIEVEFDYKWKESIGQAIHYAEATNKKPAIAIIKRKDSSVDYIDQVESALNYLNLNIDTFIISE